jgi:DNA-binding CsgD family transcriptional regulator
VVITSTRATLAASVASVVRLIEALTVLDGVASFPGVVLPRLAEVIECDAVTYAEVGQAGVTRRLDHPAGDAAEPAGARHRLTLTMALPGRCLVGITFRRSARGFTAAERELLEVLRAPLVAGLARAHADASPTSVPPAVDPFGLTRREQQVLGLVAQGRTDHAIAHALGISPRTVGKHLEHCYRKLAVSSRAAAVATLR